MGYDINLQNLSLDGNSNPVMGAINPDGEIRQLKVDSSGALITAGGGGGGGAGSDRELVVSTYLCKNAFTGASVGDTITSTQIIDVTSTPTTVSVIWRNQTTALDLVGVPLVANLELVGSSAMTFAEYSTSGFATETTLASVLAKLNGTINTNGLTDAQLRATPLVIPAGASTSVKQDTLIGTQTITMITNQSVTIGGTSVQSASVNASTNRVIITTTTDCWVNLGTNPTSAVHTTGSGFFLTAGASTYPISVTSGTTKISVIQDTSAGYLSIIEIA